MGNGRLEGKVVFITGSTRGIGRAIAGRCAEEGASVVVTGRSVELGRKVESEIRGRGGAARFLRMDVTDPVSVETAVRESLQTFGRLDGLVNNAAAIGVRGDGPVTEVTLEAWNARLATNLGGCFHATKHCVRAMIESGESGSVVMISSVAGTIGVMGADAYAASKGGVIALTRSVAAYYSRHRIRCNCLAVGFVDSGSGSVGRMLDDSEFAREVRRHHLGRIGSARDVANVVLFLLSDEAAFVNAAVIPVDGGFSSVSLLERPEIGRSSPSNPQEVSE